MTRFIILNQCPPEGFTLVGPRWTKKHDTTRPENILPEHRSTLSKGSSREAIDAWVQEKPRLKAARAQRMMYSTPSDDQEFDGIMKNVGRKLERRSRNLETSLKTGKLQANARKTLVANACDWIQKKGLDAACTIRKYKEAHIESQRICTEVKNRKHQDHKHTSRHRWTHVIAKIENQTRNSRITKIELYPEATLFVMTLAAAVSTDRGASASHMTAEVWDTI